MINQKVLNHIISNVTKYKVSNHELIIRCPYCGDSEDERKSHLYINIDDDQNVFPFHCFRCETSGSIYKLLKDLNLLNSEIIIDLYINKNTIKSKYINKKELTFEKLPDKYDNKKLNYIKERLNIPFDEDIPEYIKKHIITDFTNVCENILSMYTIDMLNNNYVGFRTFNKRKLVCRKINNDDKLNKYFNVMINNVNNDYFITSETDINVFRQGRIILGEGIFTALSGYMKLKNKLNLNNSIIVAGNGKSYFKSYNFAVYTFGIPDWDLYVLADSDVNIQFLKYQFKTLSHRNNIKVLYTDKNDFADDWKKYSIQNLF